MESQRSTTALFSGDLKQSGAGLFFRHYWKQILIVLLCVSGIPAYSQSMSQPISKPGLDFTAPLDFNEWPHVELANPGPGVSDDGKYVFYTVINWPTVGVNNLIIQASDCKWRRVIPRVDARPVITRDSKEAILRVADDSLRFVSLGMDNEVIIPHVRSYKTSTEGQEEWLAYLRTDPEDELVVRDMSTHKEQHFAGIKDYRFNKKGTALLLTTEIKTDLAKMQGLQWLNLADGKLTTIWQGEKAHSFAFDESGEQVAFIVEAKRETDQVKSLWYYRSGMGVARLEADEESPGVDANLTIDVASPEFSKDGARIFFRLTEKPLPQPTSDAIHVNVWNYKDVKSQSSQLEDESNPRSFAAVIYDGDSRVIRLQQEQEQIVLSHTGRDDYAIVYTTRGMDAWWNPTGHSTTYLVSTLDGSRKIVMDNTPYLPGRDMFSLSPDGRWVIYFDGVTKCWFSYEIATGTERNISQDMPYPTYSEYERPSLRSFQCAEPVGIGRWMQQDKAVLIYDDYDIWQVDPAGINKPVNITQGYGRSHNIKFRLAKIEENDETVVLAGDALLLSAFDVVNKFNGFYRKTLSVTRAPELLTMGPYFIYAERSQLTPNSNSYITFLLKARNANVWAVSRRSTIEAPNLYLTDDFKNYTPLSNLQPHKAYNWLTAELVRWKMLDGQTSAGVLYKPENFDPAKKYPVIFSYYERRSDGLYDYPTPFFFDAEINISFCVSRGYLVFVPDIYYRIGHPGQSVVNSVVSAAQYLSKLPYVDAKHMGINGHSFGGFETNYLVTHTHLFAAALEVAGPTDYVSAYDSSDFMQTWVENGQGRILATLWERPDLYIENSPVLNVDQVTTPLLIMHNQRDYSPFGQAVELFTALRRLGKRVWLLQYDHGGHNVSDNDARDYTIRVCQFFDHYLKGAAPPRWMTEGVPARLKGIETGLELDTSGKEP